MLEVKQKKGKTGSVTDEGADQQIKLIESLMQKSESIIVATDAGREGELIFRLIYEYLECRKPFKRLWISSLTEKAIREGYINQPRADQKLIGWLVSMLHKR
jgi:DNA topoisomerase-3